MGGEVANWTILGDRVTFMGSVAHTYRQPHDISDWNTEPVPSPIVGDNAVVGEGALLVGGITIGPRSYIAAREVVRCNVAADSLFLGGRIVPLSRFRGFIRARP